MDSGVLRKLETWARLHNRREQLLEELEKIDIEISLLEKNCPQLGNVKGVLGGGAKKKKKPDPALRKGEPDSSLSTPDLSSLTDQLPASPPTATTSLSPVPNKRPAPSPQEKEARKKMKNLNSAAKKGQSAFETSKTSNKMQVFE